MADPRHHARKTLYDMLLTNLPGELTTYGLAFDLETQIKFENQPFEPVVDKPFLAAYVIYQRSMRASIGTTKRFDEHEGFFCIEVQVPATTGMGALWLLAGACERALQEKQTQLEDGSYLSLKTSLVKGNTSQDEWYFVTVMVPFCIYSCSG